MEGFLAILVILLPFAGLIYFLVWFVRRQLQSTWMHTGILADETGMILARRNEKHGMGDFPVLQGYCNKRRVDIFTHVVGSGKHRHRVTTLHIYCQTHPANSLSIWKEGMMSKIGIALGMQDIKTGNIEFDDKFVLKSHSDIFARSVFDYNTCILALQAHGFFSSSGLYLKNGRFEYTESVVISNDKIRNRFKNMIIFADALCRRVEHGQGQTNAGMRAQ
ncbi:MAG: hypothetical protein FD123_979 [Bacteroidetes bacterium]|nr:MAG: hypothetical protein FD123_979 [Bacteroidota bacterium]